LRAPSSRRGSPVVHRTSSARLARVAWSDAESLEANLTRAPQSTPPGRRGYDRRPTET
jgi:hypothetical protein